MTVVLVVDDEPTITETLSLILESGGYRCHVAHDGQQALRALSEVSPSLVLLDIMMPVLDGSEVLRRMRADERWRRVPVIVMTAALAGERGLERHDAFFRKPFDVDQLLSEVRRLVGPTGERK